MEFKLPNDVKHLCEALWVLHVSMRPLSFSEPLMKMCVCTLSFYQHLFGAHKYWVSWFQINKCSAFCLFVFFFFFPTSVNQRLSPGGFASTGRSSVAFPRGSSALVGCFYLPPDCMSPGAELPCGGCQHTQSESNAGVDGWDEKTKHIIVLLAPNSNLQRKLVSIPVFPFDLELYRFAAVHYR